VRALGLALSLSVLLTSPAVLAEDLSAEQIIEKAMGKSNVGLTQGTATLEMTIINKRGEAKQRTLEIKAMRDAAGLMRSLVRFDKPAEVAGISFLVREKKDALPDQYVYVPAAKVVRRVAAGNAGSSFFGSDFTYGDLMPLPASERDKVKTTKLADQKVGGLEAYVIEIVPQIEGSPYGKVTTYVDKKHLSPLKVEFFDPKMKLLKVLNTKKLKKIKELGDDPVPVHLVMKNVQQNTRTELKIKTLNPKAKLSDADFTEEAMQR
jgi:hypothetical protein